MQSEPKVHQQLVTLLDPRIADRMLIELVYEEAILLVLTMPVRSDPPQLKWRIKDAEEVKEGLLVGNWQPGKKALQRGYFTPHSFIG
jgi:hypothetical protein